MTKKSEAAAGMFPFLEINFDALTAATNSSRWLR
jgi:hypothetical protein